MLGWQIFKHALRMVFGNFKQVLRITIGPAVITTGVLMAMSTFMVGSLEPIYFGAYVPPPEVAGRAIGLRLIALLLFSVTFIWIAVVWHRFVLLEEYPTGFLPKVSMNRVLAYFWCLFLLGLAVLAFSVPLMLIYTVLGQDFLAAAILVLAGGYVFLATVLLRLSITLPATAIGDPLLFKEAWEKTKGANGAILILVLLSFVFQLLVQFVLGLFSLIPVLGVLLSIFIGMLIIPMVNLSILTTMYGVFIEKRQLA